MLVWQPYVAANPLPTAYVANFSYVAEGGEGRLYGIS